MQKTRRSTIIKKVSARVPVRIDFAGGTLDMPPLYIFHRPVWTINAAINLYASVSVEKSNQYEVVSKDQDSQVSFKEYSQRIEDQNPKLCLILRSLKNLNTGPVHIETNCLAPAGAGLGGSSALLVALHKALFRYCGIKKSARNFIEYVKSIETSVIRVPTGYQDYWGAYYGGVNAYQVSLEGDLIKKPLGDKEFLRKLEESLVLVYVGKPRFSGVNNWEMFRRNISQEKKSVKFFDDLRDNALEMLQAFEEKDVKKIAQALTKDWHTRKKMIPTMSTPEINSLEKDATKLGINGFRVCGAGGGGCILLIGDKAKKAQVSGLVQSKGMRVLPISLVGPF